MASKRLTDTQVRNFKPKERAYDALDDQGLSLFVTPSGGKHWRFRYTYLGKDARCSLGSYPEMSLSEARVERDRLRKLLRSGVKPTEAKKNSPSVEPDKSYTAVARAWAKEQSEHKSWRASYVKQVIGTLEKEVFPVVGDKRFDLVSPADFRNLLTPIRDRDAKTVAKLIQQWCVAIGHYGVLHGYADVNTAASLRGFIKTKPKSHHRPLSEADLPLLFSRLGSGAGTEPVRLAVFLLAHTFVRPSELRCAVWKEFDLQGGLWTIPRDRMKSDREHKVPLTPQVIAMLLRVRELKLHKVMLFPNIRDRDRPMSPTTLNRYLERLGYGGHFSAHGFRATASTLLNAWGLPPDVIESQLAHVDKNLTRRSYNQAEYMGERRAMMVRWSDYLQSLGGIPVL